MVQIMGEIIQVMIEEEMINQRKKNHHQEIYHNYLLCRFHKIMIKNNKKRYKRQTQKM
jgi:hypothetical protein